MTANPGTNRAECFRNNAIDLFSGCSIFVNHFMSGNFFENICYAFNFTATPSLLFEINSMKSDILLLCAMVTCKKSLFHLGYHV